MGEYPRGGGWTGYAGGCRVSNRYDLDPGNRGNLFGFRVAASSQ
jgi:formylglycine-generating enzyme required for sulfatase activity